MNHSEEQARRIARLLDESTRTLDPDTCAKIAEARKVALGARREAVTELVPAWAGRAARLTERPVLGVRYMVPIAALVLGLLGIAYVHNGAFTNDIADIDAGLLTDELPISAYLDKGFDSWLKRSSR